MLSGESMGKVYSYLRFSSKGQADGDSRRRQLKAAHDYCQKRGLKLETTTFEDLGVSAWKGRNFTEGALGAFLRAVDDGLIEQDSTLLVEHLDRVTREKPLKAQELFIGIVNRGLTLVTLNDGAEYSEASLNGDVSKLLIAVIRLSSANDENEKKSKRIRERFDENRRNGIVSACPKWLKKAPDRKSYEHIPERVNAVQRMFELCVSGYGIYQIAKTLTAEGHKSFALTRPKDGSARIPREWRGVQIARILHDQAVLGHQNARTAGVVREGYYGKPIVEPHTFHAAQAAMERRNKIGRGRKGDKQLFNLLAGLLRCECGTPIRYFHQNRPVVRCEAALHHSCDAPYFLYKPVEDELLATLLLDSDHLLISEHKHAGKDEGPDLREKITRRKAQRQRLLNFVMDGDIRDDDAREQLDKLKAEINELEAGLRKVEEQRNYQPEDAAEINNALYFEHYDAIIDEAPLDVLYDIRNRLQEAIRKSLKRIVLTKGTWYERVTGNRFQQLAEHAVTDKSDVPYRRFRIFFQATPDQAFDLFCVAPRTRSRST